MNPTRRATALEYLALARADVVSAERTMQRYLKLAREYGCTADEIEEATGSVAS